MSPFDDFDMNISPEEYYQDGEESPPWEDDEPADIDGDFGYDPYAGGPEMDDQDFHYESWQDESDLWGEM